MPHNRHVCPWWMGYFLINPIRRLMQDPIKILSPYVREGMTILEIGPGMGYFTIPMARIVGDAGKITAVDIQEQMLKALGKRAQKARVAHRVELRRSVPNSLCLDGIGRAYDFTLAFAVVHEVPDQEAFFRELHAALKPGALMLMADPRSHFSPKERESALALAHDAGLLKIGEPAIWRNWTALLRNQDGVFPASKQASANV